MWHLYPVPFWRQLMEWWRGRPGEPIVMRRRVDGRWQVRSLTEAEHAERRQLGLQWQMAPRRGGAAGARRT